MLVRIVVQRILDMRELVITYAHGVDSCDMRQVLFVNCCLCSQNAIVALFASTLSLILYPVMRWRE